MLQEVEPLHLQETLLSAFERSEETYDSRRLSQAVTDLGIKVGRFKVRRLMRELAIKAKCPKAKVWRKQAADFAENIANKQCAMMPNTLWAGDITSSTTHRRKPPSDIVFHSDRGL